MLYRLSWFLFLFVMFLLLYIFVYFFFFQAEDGIRDLTVTGVQTCALPIYLAVISECVSVHAEHRRRVGAHAYHLVSDRELVIGGLDGIRIARERDREARSEERRVWKECRTRWTPYH